MKKFLLAILSIFYITASLGATIHLHYCMDTLVSRSLQVDHDRPCSKCGMSKQDTKGCCKDEQEHVKLQTDQKTSERFSLPAYFSPTLDIICFQQYQCTFYYNDCFKLPNGNAPPDIGSASLYLRNNVLRI